MNSGVFLLGAHKLHFLRRSSRVFEEIINNSSSFDQFKVFEDRFGRAAIFNESSYTTPLLDRSQVRTGALCFFTCRLPPSVGGAGRAEPGEPARSTVHETACYRTVACDDDVCMACTISVDGVRVEHDRWRQRL